MAKPKIRFNGYTEDWEQRKLGDIVIQWKAYCRKMLTMDSMKYCCW